DDGLAVELEGALADAAGNPHGALRWVFAAPDKNSFATFVRLWELPDDLAIQAAGYDGLAPMRLAGTVRLGERGTASTDIRADGSVVGGRFQAVAKLDGGIGHWRAGGADMELTVDASDVVHSFGVLAGRAASGEARERKGEVFI